MASNEKVDELISQSALDGFDKLNEKINSSITALEKLIGQGLEINKAFAGNGTTGFKQAAADIKTLDENEKSLAQTSVALAASQAKLNNTIQTNAEIIADLQSKLKFTQDAQKAYKKELDDGQVSYDRFLEKQGQAIRQAAQYKAELKLLTDQMKAVSTANFATPNSIGAANAQNKIITAQKVATPITDTAKIKELNDLLDRNNKIIDENGSKLERQKINIGNYAGSLGGAFAVLQAELVKVREALQTVKPNTAGYDDLAKKEQLLSGLTENLSRNFSTTKQEILAYTDAAKKLGLQVGLTDATFVEFSEELGTVKNTADRVARTLKFEANDTKYLTAAINAVRGLAGAYSVAQGAAALFGDDSEQLQKKLVQLQAVLAISHGLQEVANATQTESGIVRLALAAKTAILSAAERVQAALFAQTAVATQAQVVAQEEAVVVGEEQVVVEAEVAVAKTADTVATEALTVANKGLWASFGIVGLALAAVTAAIIYIVSKIPDWVKSNDITIKQQGELADALGKTREAMIEHVDEIDVLNKTIIRDIKDRNELEAASGITAAKKLASEKVLATAERDNTAERLQNLRKIGGSEDDLQQHSDNYTALKLIALKKLSAAILSNNKDQIKSQTDLIDGYDKIIGADKTLLGALLNTKTELYTQTQKVETLTADAGKLAADERRKLILAEAQIETEIIKSRNGILLADEQLSLDQRFAILKKNANAEKALARAQNSNIQNDPTQSSDTKIAAAKTEAAKISDITRQLNKTIDDDRYKYDLREINAITESAKLKLEANIHANTLILDNDKKSFSERSTALGQSLIAQQAIEQISIGKELQNRGLTESEKLEIQTKGVLKQEQLLSDYSVRRLALVKQAGEQEKALIEKEQKQKLDAIEIGLQEQVIAKKNGDINGQDNIDEEAIIYANIQIEKARAAVDAQVRIVNATKAGTAEQFAAEKDLKDKVIALQDQILAKKKLVQSQLVQDLTDIKEHADKVFNLISGAVNISTTAQKNALQSQSDQIDKNTQAEINAVNTSADSAEKKAARIAVIEARAQAQKDQIALRQRQLDQQQAIADKAKAIFDIILGTAVAVAKATTPFEKAFDAAVGAAQLAIAIATPIPKFATGTMDAPGGAAIVGDGGRQEMVVTPDGRLMLTPDSPTVMNIPKHSVVLPDARAMMENGAIGASGRVPTISEARAMFAMTDTLSGKLDKLTQAVIDKDTVKIAVKKDGWDRIKNGNKYL